jgi:hypothetical protein
MTAAAPGPQPASGATAPPPHFAWEAAENAREQEEASLGDMVRGVARRAIFLGNHRA